MSGAEHGFLTPNPALFDLENRKRKPGLAHELGAGAKCAKCGDACPGFQLHFWRKVCINCRCGKAEHNVVEESDPGFYFVGKIFDRPLRTVAEECTFIYADVVEEPVTGDQAKQEVVLDWVPPGISPSLASKYMKSVPLERLAISGSEGATRRKKALEKQFPLHDVEPSECHDLSKVEINQMTTYIDNVKKNVAGQGIVYQVGSYSQNPEQIYENLPPPLPSSLPPPLPSSSPPFASFPPPPPELLDVDSLSSQLQNTDLINQPFSKIENPGSGTFHAKPYQIGAGGLMKGPKPYGKGGLEAYGRVGSAGSSLTSSPSPPQGNSPTPEEGGLGLSRPSHYVGTSSQNSQNRLPSSQNNFPGGQNNLGGSRNNFAEIDNTHPSNKNNKNQSNNYDHPNHQDNDYYANVKNNEKDQLQGDPKHNPVMSTPGHPAETSLPRADGEIWDCSGCHQPMEPGEVAIFAERAGEDKCWHPSCFNCSRCGEMLEDLLYFFSNDELYCGRDFADMMKIPRCSACDELIFAAEYTGAEDQHWHLKHFCCWMCDRPLAGHKYIPVDGQPHCLMCWQATHGKVCSACNSYIGPEEQRVTLGENHWHTSPACFRCGVCSVSLLGGKMSRRGGVLLCSSACAKQLPPAAAAPQTSPKPLPPPPASVADAQRLPSPPQHHPQSFKQNKNENIYHSPTNSNVALNSQNVFPNSQHVLPNSQHVSPNSQHVLPNSQHISPNSQHVSPNSQHVSPNSQYISPNSQHISPNSQHTSPFPNTQHVSPNPHVSPNSQHVFPNSQHVSLNSQHVSPNSQSVSPNSKQNTLKSQQYAGSQISRPYGAPKNEFYATNPYEGIPPDSQPHGLASQQYGRSLHHSQQYGGVPQYSQQHEEGHQHSQAHLSHQYGGNPRNPQPFRDNSRQSHPHERDSQPYVGAPLNSQVYGGAPINSQSYGDPKNSQPYGGGPPRSQLYGAAPLNSQSYGGAPLSSQPYGAAPLSSQPYGGPPEDSKLGPPIHVRSGSHSTIV